MILEKKKEIKRYQAVLHFLSVNKDNPMKNCDTYFVFILFLKYSQYTSF
jgi:hypothetical protein